MKGTWKICKRSKYNAKRTCVDGITFDSIKEAEYYRNLKLLKQSGYIRMFLCQVPFILPGGVKYFCDFCEFRDDGTVHFVDVKGRETAMFKVKKKQVEALYPVEIEVV